MTPKERLLRVLRKEEVDRPPVICTGGMMNAAVVDVMKATGHTLPEAHFDGDLMAALARDVHEHTGFENFGVPFCMTVEAEVLGSSIDIGSLSCEPKIIREVFPSVSRASLGDAGKHNGAGRTGAIFRAAGRLSEKFPDIPVIGNLTGPVSASASIVDPMTFLKELRKDRDNAHRVMGFVSEYLIEFAKGMIGNGAAAVSIGDPTATGEILGPRLFEEYAVRYLNRVIEGIRAAGAPVIVHICGDLKAVRHLLPRIKSDAISTDALVNLRLLKQEFPALTTMGNVSTYLLEFGPAEKVAAVAKKLVRDGVDIISPACGLSTSTSLATIRAMTAAVKGGGADG
ncbi:MAG: uroporphyrinogen decarboxylase family protein [Candidatus Deferrimicrobiota bacterium]